MKLTAAIGAVLFALAITNKRSNQAATAVAAIAIIAMVLTKAHSDITKS